MDDKTKSELEVLRSAVVRELAPIVEAAEIDNEQRFRLLLAAAEINPTHDSYEKAHAAALRLEDDSVKAEALLDLLESIDVALGDMTFDDNAAEQIQDPQPQEQPSEEHHE